METQFSPWNEKKPYRKALPFWLFFQTIFILTTLARQLVAMVEEEAASAVVAVMVVAAVMAVAVVAAVASV